MLLGRDDFFAQEVSETLADTLRYLDVRTIVVHRDSLSPTQVTAVRHVLENGLRLSAVDFGEAVRYDVPADLAGDGVFLSRDEGWTVTFEAESAATLAGVQTAAAVALYNIDTRPRQVELTFTLSQESEGSLIVTSEANTLFDEVGARSGEVARLVLTLPPGVTTLNFFNRLPGPVIIENPRLIVR
jgi:hypothetical protein